MSQGYVLLWRKSLDEGTLKNHKLWAFWSWCLMKATHQEVTQFVGYQEVKLQPGQFIFGRKAAAAELGMTEKSIRVCLSALKGANKVAVKGTNKFSIITLVNWESEQGKEGAKGQQKGQQEAQQGANKGPTKGHKQECKECKKKELPPADAGVSQDGSFEKFQAEKLARLQSDPKKGFTPLFLAYHEHTGLLPTWISGNGSTYGPLNDALKELGDDRPLLLAAWKCYLADDSKFEVDRGKFPRFFRQDLNKYVQQVKSAKAGGGRSQAGPVEECPKCHARYQGESHQCPR